MKPLVGVEFRVTGISCFEGEGDFRETAFRQCLNDSRVMLVCGESEDEMRSVSLREASKSRCGVEPRAAGKGYRIYSLSLIVSSLSISEIPLFPWHG